MFLFYYSKSPECKNYSIFFWYDTSCAYKTQCNQSPSNENDFKFAFVLRIFSLFERTHRKN